MSMLVLFAFKAIITGIRKLKQIFSDRRQFREKSVVHGHWALEYETYGKMRCSVCKEEALIVKAIDDVGVTTNYVDSNYCPNCGAKMDGDGNG